MLLPIPKRRCRRDYRQYHDYEYISLKHKNKNKKDKNKKNNKKADWGSVRPEILTEIAKRLPTLESYECFGSVCNSWRAAAAACFASEFPHRKTTLEGPWLLLPGEAEKEEEKEECFVITRRILLGGTITRKLVDLPRGVTKSHHDRQYFISCKDWLFVVSGGGDDASLVHPLSRVQIHLPSLVTLRQHIIHLSRSPDNMRDKIIHKFVLSADPFSTPDRDFFVMVIWGEYHFLGFCKPKDSSWKVPGPLSSRYSHHLFWELVYNGEDNRLYALDWHNKLAVCNIHGTNPTELLYLHTITVPPFVCPEIPPFLIRIPLLFPPGLTEIPTKFHLINKRYLIEWKNNTFLVVYHHVNFYRIRHANENGDIRFRFQTFGFAVTEVNIVDGTCSEITQLGSKSLFVGGNSSFSVDCSKDVNKNIKPNCIYFAGDNYFMPPRLVRRSTKEIGIYSMSDRKVQCLFRYGDDKGVIVGTETTLPPIWFGPSF